VLVFFSIPQSKLVGYVLPLLAPLAVLVAEVIVAGLTADIGSITQRSYRASLIGATSLCVVMTAIATIYAQPNSVPLGALARAEFKQGDQVVMLHAYAYDLPMALRNPRLSWVVDNWNNPEIPTRDNWRKELHDAGQFSPAVMKDTLISARELQVRLCAAPAGQVFWFWGTPGEDQDAYPALHGLAPFAVSGKRALWRVVPDTAYRTLHCTLTAQNG
jgi:4-amino-4-deoxy-L-arabinose transferase-like glycosyltransferase